MQTSKSGVVRIIGGQWKGHKLRFLTASQLRPTPDRVRETLFNWLAPLIEGACCLDMFAGSGILGFEALSRGAAQVVMADNSEKTVAMLKQNAKKLGAQTLEIYKASLPQQLIKLPRREYNVVFLDPPYGQNLLQPCCHWLEEQQYLAPNAVIYLEAERELKELPIPENWQLIRSKTAGAVGFHLAQHRPFLR